MTTVASGRWTSAPVPVASAIGMSRGTPPAPSSARGAGARERPRGSPHRGSAPLFTQVANEGDHHQPVEHRHPDSAMKAIPAEMDIGMSAATTPRMPPSANGMPENTSRPSFMRCRTSRTTARNTNSAGGTTNLQALGRRFQLLEGAAPRRPVAHRDLHVGQTWPPRRRRSRYRVRERWRSPPRGACRSRG